MGQEGWCKISKKCVLLVLMIASLTAVLLSQILVSRWSTSELITSVFITKFGGATKLKSGNTTVQFSKSNSVTVQTEKTKKGVNETQIALKRYFPEFYQPNTNRSLELCPEEPPNLMEDNGISLNQTLIEIMDASVFNTVKHGGLFRPRDCIARENVAIIVPFRDRRPHLFIFLAHIHKFLQKQMLQYRIYIVEMAFPTRFNRGLVANVGFLYARRLDEHNCFVIHDVDLLPTNDKNFYRCSKNPRHLSVANSKFNFGMLYKEYTGGVIAFTRKQYEDTNGFSNLYFGWGGEDDDLYYRIRAKGYSVERPTPAVGRYQALGHGEDPGNLPNPNRFRLLGEARKHLKDGLFTCNFTQLALEWRPLYTWIYIRVPGPK